MPAFDPLNHCRCQPRLGQTPPGCPQAPAARSAATSSVDARRPEDVPPYDPPLRVLRLSKSGSIYSNAECCHIIPAAKHQALTCSAHSARLESKSDGRGLVSVLRRRGLKFEPPSRRRQFEAVVLPQLDTLYRTARGLTKSREQAEDLVQ